MNKKSIQAKRLAILLGAIALIAVAARGVLPLKAGELKDNAAEGTVLKREGESLIVPAGSSLRKTLATAAIAEQDIAVPFTLPASIEADPARLARILAPATGRIAVIRKRLGDEVKAGDVLFEVDAADFAQASSDDRKAQAALELTRRALERQRALDQAQISSRRDLEQAQSDYAQAESEAARSRTRLAQLGAGHAQAAGRLAVRSPVSGHVIELNAAPGGYWNDATAAVMTVADLSSVFITASAQEKDLSHLYVGQEAEVALDAYPAQPMRARIAMIGQVLDPDTRTVKVRMLAANQDGRLKPGMFAQATLRDKPHRGLLVPMAAVVQSGFADRVFVETSSWAFQPRKVTLGAQVGSDVEVLSGLQSGERVVTKDGVLLND
ncbi:efflux RND transporter periplasmic adaptor subunit [Herbaspirillum sp.]|uniref:efflux RND transporter periplasmic adaptor subunit n=1 Tax=Herbaspirillum sp. TaxID=1890675 RepID=UPI001B0487AB|nr:efflux RND transporter periplasmic adaptor subunit [Herbaspirillum sp.]MBO9535167.1 efflux RND transporter periplasmic adaptor subunit [Herbaspirillum sp.]